MLASRSPRLRRETYPRPVVPAALAAVLALACGGDAGPTALRPAAGLEAHHATPEWTAPEHLGDAVNSAFADAHPTVSTNQLALYFTAGQGLGGSGGRDLWVSRRTAANEPWGPPMNLGGTVNTTSHEDNPTLSRDGLRLYFSSNRPGHGGFDLWVTERDDAADDTGWAAPVNLGSIINTDADERDAGPALEGPAGPMLYFSSNRAGTADLYRAPISADGTFGTATLVTELSGPGEDDNPTIAADGRTIYFASDRDGSLGRFDLWVATRPDPAGQWSAPVNLGAPVNGASNDVGPDLSVDGRTLYFSSAFRAGNESLMYDLWKTARAP